MTGAVFYQSATRGYQNPCGHEPITYFGVTYRIPRSEHATIRQLEWEHSPDELRRSVRAADGTELQPDPQGIIERLETYDQQTGDLLVMYRIPYRRPA